MSTRRELIDAVIALVTADYVFPDVAKQVVEVLRGKEYEHLVDDAEFAATVTADLRSVSADEHLRLLHEPPRPKGAARAHGFDKIEILDGNIGYLQNTLLQDPQRYGDSTAAAMTLIADTEALIIDLRRHRGGHSAMVAMICGYLFDEFTHLNDVYVRPHDLTVQFWTPHYVPGRRFGGSKPIWVLTSSTTFSAGEELAYNLQQLGRGTIVGEKTRGGATSASSGWHKITEDLVATIPDARSINPVTGTNWAGVGVTPDIEMPAADALTHAYELARNNAV
ncbi:MAG TPA: S41 family peptidase [Pseudonocardiaceae bacterium]|jgi:C-terminal processing protease CtpA/Prc|nr:S41 family peptidase [Pseudonocardiaceae bacterium]